MVKFKSEMTSRFIKEYYKYPCLWDKKDPLYRDKVARDNALTIIKQDMKLTELTLADLRCKICSLRSTYNMELKKIYRANKMGKEYKPLLSWFHLMDSFLITGQKKRNSRGGSLPNDDSEEDIELSDTDNNESIEIRKITKTDEQSNEGLSPNHTTYSIESYPPAKSSIPKILNPTKFQSNESTIVKLPKTFIKLPSKSNESTSISLSPTSLQNLHTSTPQDIQQQHQHSNEFDIFGKSIAVQLKQLPLDVALEIQADMQTMIAKRRIAILRAQPQTTSQIDLGQFISFES